MRDKESGIKTLVEFGISRTQARVYLTLVDRGTLTLRAASEYSGVGRPDTYRALFDLKKEGLIETYWIARQGIEQSSSRMQSRSLWAKKEKKS
jgi:DNA-binding MarR family transcriptional regulator